MFFSLCFPLLLISVFSLLIGTVLPIRFGKALPLSVLFYLALVCLLLLLSANKFVYLWASLRLWGAYPKALWVYGTRQLGPDVILYPSMQSYPPGMPLLCYFMESFSLRFYDSSLYFTYGYFDVILILPLIELVAEKTEKAAGNKRLFFAKVFFFSIVAAIVLPWLVFKNYGPYVTLFIDPPLGLLAGYYYVVCFGGFGRGKYSLIAAILSGICLILIKDSGVLFAVTGAVGAVIGRAGSGKQEMKRTVIRFAGVMAVCLATWYSWRYLMGLYSVRNHLIRSQVVIPGLSLIRSFLVHVIQLDAVEIELVFLRIGLSFPAALLILFAIKLILTGFDSVRFGNELKEIVILLVASLIFLGGYLFIFREPVSRGNFPSYSRYLCTIVLCVMYILGFDLAGKHFAFLRRCKNHFRQLVSRDAKRQKLATAVRIAAFSFVFLLCLGCFFYIVKGKAKKTDPEFVHASKIADTLLQSVETGDGFTDVYLCMPGRYKINERLHHLVYYELIEKRVRIKNFYTRTNITSTGNAYSPDEFIDLLIENDYEYVMFSGISEKIYNEFGVILGSIAVGDQNLIYRVNRESRSLDRIH